MSLNLKSLLDALSRAEKAEKRCADLLDELHKTEKPIHIYVHQEPSASVDQRLTQILTRLEHIDMALTQMEAALSKIDDATNNIAADIENLKKLIVPGMSQADVDKVQARLDSTVARLEGIAASTADPVPDVPPTP